MDSEQQLIWAAGFIDGEGCLYIKEHKNSRFTPCITVAQVRRGPLEILEQLFGGTIRVRSKQRANWRTVYAWELGGKLAVEAALTKLRPYLILKQPECDVLLELTSTMRQTPGQNKPLTPDEVAHRQTLSARLKALKKATD